MNDSLCCYYDEFKVTIIVCDVLMALTILVGIFANSVICFCIYKTKTLQTYINVPIISASIADILGCLLLLPTRMYAYTTYSQIDSFDNLCSMGIFCRTLWDVVKLFMLACSSFERHRAVANPFEKDGRVKRTVVFISMSWIIAVILSIISVFTFEDSALHAAEIINRDNPQAWVWGEHEFLILPLGIISLSFIIGFYSLILHTLNEHSTKLKGHVDRRKIHPINDDKALQAKPGPLKREYSAISFTNAEMSSISIINDQLNKRPNKENNIKGKNYPKIELLTYAKPKSNRVHDIKSESTVEKKDSKNKHGENNAVDNMPNATNISLARPGTPEIAIEINSPEKSNLSLKKKKETVPIGNVHKQLTPLQNNDTGSEKSFNSTVSGKSNAIRVVDIDGTVKISKTDKEQKVVGDVCAFNSKNKIQGRRKVEVRAAKRIAVLIVTFMCCWIPFPVFVIIARSDSYISTIDYHLLMLFVTLSSSAMAINPIQHGLLNRQLNSAIKRLFYSLWSKNE